MSDHSGRRSSSPWPAGLPGDRGRTLQVLGTLGWMRRRLVLPALAAALLLAALALLPPLLLAELIDKAFPSRDAAMGLAIAAGIACIALIDAASSLARRLFAARAGLNLQRDMLIPAFASILRLPLDHVLGRDQGLLGQTLEEAEKLAQNATEGLIECGMALGIIAVLTAALVVADWRAASAIIAIIGVLTGLHLALARSLRARETAWFETRSQFWSHIVESIAYLNTVRVNSAHRFAEERFSTRLERDLAARFSSIALSAGLDAAGRLATGLIVAAIALLGGSRVMAGGMSIGDFVLVLSIGGSLSAPVLALVKSFDEMQAATVSVHRLSALARARAEDIPPEMPPARKGPARLDIDDLSFSYAPDGAQVIAGLSCTFAPGERVALVGPSGIGKSTLASLIFAARRADKGAIRLDGAPVAKIAIATLRQRILVVPHEIDVFTGTVAENIRLGIRDVGFNDIAHAASVAGLDAEITALSQGYDTRLGQAGVELSAGQKQRLGIARAILRQPDILVLDESTSSLDLATERRVLDGLLKHLPQTTIIAITHRPSVVERMERVIAI
jgi:ABC-type bacteriocin/lantibiotic exporter with double-glycine peptidase domain